MATKKNVRYAPKQVPVEVLEKEYGEGTIVDRFGHRYYKVAK